MKKYPEANLEYHKGGHCPYKNGWWCSEGYCIGCWIWVKLQEKKK